MLLAYVELHLSLSNCIKVAQVENPQLSKIIKEILKGKSKDFKVDKNSVPWFQDHLCVLDMENLR